MLGRQQEETILLSVLKEEQIMTNNSVSQNKQLEMHIHSLATDEQFQTAHVCKERLF